MTATARTISESVSGGARPSRVPGIGFNTLTGNRNRPGLPQRDGKFDALLLALAHADDPAAAYLQAGFPRPPDRPQLLGHRMRRAKFRKIGRGRFEVAVVTPHAALFEPAHLFQVQQPERRAKRNGHLGADPAIDRADPVGIGIGKRPTAGYQRKALHALACIAGRLFDRFPGSYQRIDLDFRFMKFRLSAPLAVLAATGRCRAFIIEHMSIVFP